MRRRAITEDGHFRLRAPLESTRRLGPHMAVGRVFVVNSESQTFVKTSGVKVQLQYAQLDGKVPGKNLTDKGRPDSPSLILRDDIDLLYKDRFFLLRDRQEADLAFVRQNDLRLVRVEALAEALFLKALDPAPDLFDVRPHGLALDTVEPFAVSRNRLSEFELLHHNEHLLGAAPSGGFEMSGVLLAARPQTLTG